MADRAVALIFHACNLGGDAPGEAPGLAQRMSQKYRDAYIYAPTDLLHFENGKEDPSGAAEWIMFHNGEKMNSAAEYFWPKNNF